MTIPRSSDAFENFYPKNLVRNPNRFAVPQLTLQSTLPTQLRITFEAAVSTSDAAVVVLNVALNDVGWAVEGTSKRDPADKPDRELGMLIALQRALDKLSHQIARQTNGRVEHNDQMRTQQKFQKLQAAMEKETPVEANVVESKEAEWLREVNATWFNPDAPTIVFDHGIDEDALASASTKKVSKRKGRKQQKAVK